MTASPYSRVIRNALWVTLKSHGFHLFKRAWYRHTNEVIQVVHLAWTRFQGRQHPKVDLWIKRKPYLWETANVEVDSEHPQPHLCHFHLSAQFIDERAFEMVSPYLLNEPDSDVDESRGPEVVRRWVESVVVPFLDRTRTELGVANEWSARRFDSGFVHPVMVRELKEGLFLARE